MSDLITNVLYIFVGITFFLWLLAVVALITSEIKEDKQDRELPKMNESSSKWEDEDE